MGRILGVEINEGKNADGKMSDSTMADVEPCIRTCFRLHRWEIAKSVVLWSDLKGYITAYSTINGIDKQTFFMSAQSGTPSASTRLAYPGGKIPLKEAKANDIKKALQYVPVEHLEFYNEINPTCPNVLSGAPTKCSSALTMSSSGVSQKGGTCELLARTGKKDVQIGRLSYKLSDSSLYGLQCRILYGPSLPS
ncbi:hypothetical protein J6590_104674 [Homalodisca vitripennis]|nr:hypothetical protein J6590_104674 [Homalodisca vitripennis]